MPIGGSSDSSPSRSRRRDAARVKAKELRVSQKKKDRRNKVFLQGGMAIAAVAIVVLVALVIVNSIKPAGPGPKNMASDGALIGEGLVTARTPALQPDADPRPSEADPTGAVANIRLYVDYLCPLCADFEDANTEQIAQWVDSGAATVEIHPIAILANKSAGTKYSLRAANASACVANYSPDDFFAFSSALFVDQPKETSPGRSNDELKNVVTDSGVSEALSSINSCIDDGTYESWVEAATDRSTAGPIPNSSIESIIGTPTILVNGKPYTGSFDDPKEFASFVQQALGETYSTSTSTSTPTPTPATPAP